MVYFVGRDVDVWIGTEEASNSLHYSGSSSGPNWNTTDATAVTNYTLFAVPRGDVASYTTGLDYLTGVDLSIGAMDEDITYLGFKDVTKVEIKKETTLTLTRKKMDATWDQVFNNARFGITGANIIEEAGQQEPTQNKGYRVIVSLKTGNDVFTIRNACIQGHTVTQNADGTSDETLEFMSYVDPKIAQAAIATQTPLTDL
jgi:hypothetical protein